MRRVARKRNAVLTLLTGAVVVMIGWTQNWVSLSLSDSDIATRAMEATGQESSFLPAGLALISLATGLVLLTARKYLAFAIAIVNMAVAMGLAVLLALFIADPVTFELKPLSQLTGIADSSTLHSLVATASIGFGVAVTATGAVFVAAGAALSFAGFSHWSGTRSRYEKRANAVSTQTQNGSVSTLDAWDEMSRGTDPTT